MKTASEAIMIAIHKDCTYYQGEGYLPIQVGAQCNPNTDLPITKDNTGENISDQNGVYCELTALYWYWKNGDLVDYTGLVHYRRYFVKHVHLFGENKTEILTCNDIRDIFRSGKKIILPKKCSKSKCNGRLYKNKREEYQDVPLLLTKKIIEEDYPEYLDSFCEVAYENGKVSFGNMFICGYDDFTNYCEWVFDVLKKLANKLEIVPPRMMGFVSEYLLCAWAHYRFQENEIEYTDVINIEDSNIKNWAKSIKLKLN